LIRAISFFLLLSLFCSIGCKSKKLKDNPVRSIEDVYEALKKHNVDYQWFTAKAKIKLSNEDDFIPSVTSYIRINRDTAIWMVFKKLNIEVARAMIKPDSFCVVYRFDRVYEKASTQELLAGYQLDLSFREIQDYLVGNIPDIVTDNMEIRQNDKELICQTEINQFLAYLRLDPVSMQLNGFDLFNQKNESVIGRFEDYKEIDGKPMAHKREFTMSSNASNYGMGNGKAKFDLSDIKINEAASMRFNIPSHYDQIKYYR